MPRRIQGRQEAFFASALTKAEQKQLNALLRKLMLAFEASRSAGLARPTAVRSPASPVRGPSAWNGSGSRVPSTQSATYSPSAGPCLKPWPEPPPSSHHDSCSGGGATRKCVSPVSSYWQTRAPTIGASASDGNRVRGVRARLVLAASRERHAVERVGVDLRARDVGRDLHAEPGDLAVPVERRVVLAEAGRAAPRPVAAEEEDVAPRDPSARRRCGKSARQPRAARPDDDVGARRRRRASSAPVSSARRAARRPRRAAASRAARAARRRPARRARRAGRRRRATGRGARVVRRRATRRGCRAAASDSRLCASKPSARCANHARPTGSQMRVPVSSCSSSHASRARQASSVYQSTSPCAARSRRVSPPDAERTVPGVYCSTSVTSQPRRASSRAVEAPKTPAPTTVALLTRDPVERLAQRARRSATAPRRPLRPPRPRASRRRSPSTSSRRRARAPASRCRSRRRAARSTARARSASGASVGASSARAPVVPVTVTRYSQPSVASAASRRRSSRRGRRDELHAL